MRLLNFLRRPPAYVFERASNVPEFDMQTFMKTIKLSHVAWDYPNAYRLVSGIYFCVNLVMDAIASTPLRFYTEAADGKKTYLKPEPGNVAGLWATANGEDTGRDLIAGIAGSRRLFGTGHLFFDNFGSDRIQGIYQLNPLAVEIIPGRNRSIAGWKVKDGHEWKTFPRAAIEHFPMFDPRFNRMPVSPLEPLTVEYEAMYDSMRVIRNLARSSFVPPGFFRTKSVGVDDDVRRRLGRQIRRMLDLLIKGKQNAMILPGDLEFQGAAHKISEMNLTEIDRNIFMKILNVFRIPPPYAGIYEGSGMNSDVVDAATGLFHELVREPECAAIVAVMNERVLPRFGVTGVKCEFDFSAILAVMKQRIKAATQIVALTGGPILTRNEGREWIGMVKLKDPEADELLTGIGSMTSTERESERELAEDAAKAGNAKAVSEDPKRAAPSSTAHVRARRDRQGRMQQRALRVHERRMGRGFRRVFARQQERVKLRLRDELDRALNGKFMAAARAIDLDDLLRDDSGDTAIIRRIVRLIVEERGNAAIGEAGQEFAFLMSGRKVREFIDAHSAEAITNTSSTTRDRLRAAIGEGVEANETLDQLIARVDDVFDGRRKNVATIARSETTPAYGMASVEGWEQSGVVEFKEWLTAHDDAVRESHREADGQTVRLDQDFTVGTDSMQFPGGGSIPEENLNCRCVQLPVLRERMRDDGIPGPIRDRMASRTLGEWLNART